MLVSKTATIKTVATVDQQIATMRSHDIHFLSCTEEEAATYLEENTYFFKLKAFDKLFGRDDEGKYFDLDFAHLKDAATIDYHLRRLILQLTSDVEHALKVRFNQLLMRRTSEDPYVLVQEFIADQKQYYCRKFGGNRPYDINGAFKRSAYTDSIIDKYGSCPPAWLIWEACSLNEFNAFYRFFLRRSGYSDITFALLDGVRILRNAAAHNNCLLTAPSYTVNKTNVLQEYLSILLSVGFPNGTASPLLTLSQTDPLVHDLSCVVCCHINTVHSSGMKKSAIQASQSFLTRVHRHMDWYRQETRQCTHLCNQLDAICSLLTAFCQPMNVDCKLTEQPRIYQQRRDRHRRHSH